MNTDQTSTVEEEDTAKFFNKKWVQWVNQVFKNRVYEPYTWLHLNNLSV